jgi:hypothetical protein
MRLSLDEQGDSVTSERGHDHSFATPNIPCARTTALLVKKRFIVVDPSFAVQPKTCSCQRSAQGLGLAAESSRLSRHQPM